MLSQTNFEDVIDTAIKLLHMHRSVTKALKDLILMFIDTRSVYPHACCFSTKAV